MIYAILVILLLLATYGCYNSVRKNEKLEKIKLENENDIIRQQKHIQLLSDTIEGMNKKIKIINAKGTFDSDDEIGFFFKEIIKLQNQFVQKNK